MSDSLERRDSEARTASGSQEEVQRFLSFSLCNEEYAVPLLKVREVIALPDITSVPHTPAHFKGIMNLRGQIISVIDLRLKFKMAKADTTQETAVIILDIAAASLGVVVDSIDSVLAVETSNISDTPDIESVITSDYITGVTRKDKKLVLLLDIERTLSVEDMSTMRHQQSKQPKIAA